MFLGIRVTNCQPRGRALAWLRGSAWFGAGESRVILAEDVIWGGQSAALQTAFRQMQFEYDNGWVTLELVTDIPVLKEAAAKLLYSASVGKPAESGVRAALPAETSGSGKPRNRETSADLQVVADEAAGIVSGFGGLPNAKSMIRVDADQEALGTELKHERPRSAPGVDDGALKVDARHGVASGFGELPPSKNILQIREAIANRRTERAASKTSKEPVSVESAESTETTAESMEGNANIPTFLESAETDSKQPPVDEPKAAIPEEKETQPSSPASSGQFPIDPGTGGNVRKTRKTRKTRKSAPDQA